jgi:DNA polymerase-3 subunit delta
MRIQSDQLPKALEKGLAHAYLVAGDEILLTGEAADAVRARARREGFTGRDLFVTDRSFDWSEVANASRTMSLFAERRIVEVRMPTPRPGKAGGAVLAELAADPGPGNLLLVVTTRPEKEAWSSAWLKAFEKHGVFVQTASVDIERLPQWILERAGRLGLGFDRGAAELIAERVEGNLLAAQQEIEKLALLHPGARLGADEVGAAVANSARYDVYQLGEAALAGDAARALRILDGLRAEGAEAPLVLWALCRELRSIVDARNGVAGPAWGPARERRQELIGRALRRTAGQPIERWFEAAAHIDRQAKGRARGGGDPWTSLAGLVATMSGVRLPPAMLRGRTSA